MSQPVPASQSCPLCGDVALHHARSRWGNYYRCQECDLVSQLLAERLDAAGERAHYDSHENSPDDAGYRAFLARLADPLFARLRPGARGLDYGAGPGPTLSVMAADAGLEMCDYDPFFAPDAALLQQQYEFIACTEVAEHFHRPDEEFARLAALLEPGGLLGLMTERHDEVEDFAAWWYHRDPTHVVFYSAATLEWICRRFGFDMLLLERSVVVLRRTEGG